jgi:hypothetical protein
MMCRLLTIGEGLVSKVVQKKYEEADVVAAAAHSLVISWLCRGWRQQILGWGQI